jgi:hypothetical protein
MRYPDFKRKALTFSYDDGVKYDRRLIEIFDKNGLKGTFNINSGLFGENKGDRRLTKEETLELYKDSPHEIAVHGYRHLSLTEVDTARATYDVARDRTELETLFGRTVQGMAYANGAFDDTVVEILKNCGINYARTTVSTECFNVPDDWLRMPATCHHGHPRLMEFAKTFVEAEEDWYIWRKTPMLFYVWGHSYEFDDNDNWNIIEEFAEYMGGREDIWYVTNGELFEYVQAFNRLVFSMEGNIVYNPSAIPVWFVGLNWKKYKIEAGQTLVLE